MLAAVALSAALFVNAADVKNEAWVVVTKRAGVAKAAANEMAKTVSDTLSKNGVPNPTDPADLTSCNAKLACLVDAALKKRAAVLVVVETASVLDDVVIHVEALSVEEDGKKLATLDYEGPARQFSADAAAKATDNLVPAIRAALGIAAAPIAKPAEPVVAEPPPEAKPKPVAAEEPPPTAPVVVKPAEPSQGLRGTQLAGIAVAAVGVIGLGVGVGLGVKAMGDAGKKNQLCPAGMPCTNPDAYTAYNDARGAQNLALPFAVLGGVLAAGGVVLLFVDFGGGSDVKVAPAVSPDSAGAFLTGTF